MPMLWIVQQQLDKAHHITPTNVVKGAVEFPAQGSGGWVRPSLPLPVPDPDARRVAMGATRALIPSLSLTLALNLAPRLRPQPSP